MEAHDQQLMEEAARIIMLRDRLFDILIRLYPPGSAIAGMVQQRWRAWISHGQATRCHKAGGGKP